MQILINVVLLISVVWFMLGFVATILDFLFLNLTAPDNYTEALPFISVVLVGTIFGGNTLILVIEDLINEYKIK